MNSQGPAIVPAAGRHGLTARYDRAVALTMRERRFRSDLQRQLLASIPHGGTVVDVGAGTGTFAISLARARPDASVRAVDGDPEALGLARGKAGAQAVEWLDGLAGELPVAERSADAVVMSLLLHHLDLPAKQAALAEGARVLRPGGSLHIADWGRPGDPLMRAAFFALQLLDGFSNTRDHASGRLPAICSAAGFVDVRCHLRLRTVWGRLELLSASRPSPNATMPARQACLDSPH